MPGPLQLWNQFPRDSNLGDSALQCLDWMTVTLNQLQPQVQSPSAPMVTTVSHPGGVQLVWNETPGTTQYALYETNYPTTPPGVPIATVPANIGAVSNSYLRASITDTTTRYYTVIPIANHARGAASVPVPGTALITTAPTVTISAAPISQSGVGGGVGGGGGITGIYSDVRNT
jgi:hypothetical protein